MQRVGHAPAINGQVGDRCLVKDVPVGRCEEGDEFGQQDVLGAELQTAGDGLVQGGGGRCQGNARSLGLAVQPMPDLGKAGGTPAQYGIQIFEHARMSADSLKDGAQIVVAPARQLGQANDQLAGFGGGEWRQGQRFKPAFAVWRAMSGGDQQAAMMAGLAKGFEPFAHHRIGVVPATDVEILLKIVKNQKQFFGPQTSADGVNALPVVAFGKAEAAGKGVDVEGAGQGNAGPAVFTQARHDAAGEGALAHASHALQNHADPLPVALDGTGMVTQDGEGLA